MKAPLKSITLTRAEGYAHECYTVEVASFDEADNILRAWALTAPDSGGYDKCDFKVFVDHWGDENIYEGRFDLQREHTQGRCMLQAQMMRVMAFQYGIDPDMVSVKGEQ